jgi:hypothetical protein
MTFDVVFKYLKYKFLKILFWVLMLNYMLHMNEIFIVSFSPFFLIIQDTNKYQSQYIQHYQKSFSNLPRYLKASITRQ